MQRKYASQITIPISIEKINIKEGDKIVFIEKDGNMIIANSAMMALQRCKMLLMVRLKD